MSIFQIPRASRLGAILLVGTLLVPPLFAESPAPRGASGNAGQWYIVAANEDGEQNRVDREAASRILDETIQKRVEEELARKREEARAEEVTLTAQDWKSRYRLLLIHVDNEDEDALATLRRQLNAMEEYREQLATRETLMIVLGSSDSFAFIGNKRLAADSAKALRTRYFPSGQDFDLKLVDKSGIVLLRRVDPVPPDYVLDHVDRNPQRKREVQRQLRPSPIAGERRLQVR